MANVQHASLTGSDLHEPKGADTASANQVYVADGAGSGTWQKITPSQVSSRTEVVVVHLSDISTAKSIYIPFLSAATITKVITVIDGAIATADATLTVYNSAGASMGNIVIAYSGSAAGDIDTLDSPANNSVVEDDFIRIATDGASTNSINATIMIQFTV